MGKPWIADAKDYAGTFDESEHPRGAAGTSEGGQFVPKGFRGRADLPEIKTTADDVLVFHGMQELVVDDIKANGLKPTAARSQLGKDAKRLYYSSGRAKVVFATTDEKVAQKFAFDAAQAVYRRGERSKAPRLAMVAMKIPRDQFESQFKKDRVMKDENSSFYTKSIPPEWIHSIEILNYSTWQWERKYAVSDGDVVNAYTVIAMADAEDKD